MDEQFTRYDHEPAHLFRPGATYCVTAKTLKGEPILAARNRRQELLDGLEFASRQRGWLWVAWVALSNHYHCVLRAPDEEAASLSDLIHSAHSFTARRWNAADQTAGRQVWYQYWDTCLTSAGSFYARLNYIHYNPVKHGYVSDPAEYDWSSCALWQSYGTDGLREMETAYPWDQLNLE